MNLQYLTYLTFILFNVVKKPNNKRSYYQLYKYVDII